MINRKRVRKYSFFFQNFTQTSLFTDKVIFVSQ